MAVALFRFLFPLLADSGFEVDGLMGGLVPGSSPTVGDLVGNVGPEEHKEIQKSHHRQQRTQEVQLDQVLDHNDGKDHAVQQGQPFDLHRDDEHDQKLGVRIEHGKGEEHGEVHIVGAGDPDVLPGDKARDDAGEKRQNHAAEIVKGELGGAPLPLQGISDHVVEVQKDRQPENISGRVVPGHEEEGHQPPDLKVLDSLPAEAQKADGLVPGENCQQINDDVADDDELHQIGDAEVGMGIGEPIHSGV